MTAVAARRCRHDLSIPFPQRQHSQGDARGCGEHDTREELFPPRAVSKTAASCVSPPVQLILANDRSRALACVALWLGAIVFALAGFFLRAEESRGLTRKFDLPADVAEVSLKRFAEQSGRGVVFVPERVKGVKTNAVKGEWTPAEAL